MRLSGIRGAVKVETDTKEQVFLATKKLLQKIVEANGLRPDDIVAAWFSQTSDLVSAYPAEAARQLGWDGVALMCGQEAAVEESLNRCIRVLCLCYIGDETKVQHVYLGEAKILRPDLGDAT